MAYLKLGQILINEGIITEEQLKKAIEYQQSHKGRIGENLVKLGIITEDHIVQAIGLQLGIPYYTGDQADQLIPQEDTMLFCKFTRNNVFEVLVLLWY